MIFLLIFNYDEWYEIYAKNCTLRPINEWNSDGQASAAFGVFYLTMGFLSELLYIPFMIAMLKPEIFQHSCYKIMFLLGLIDMITIPSDTIVPGIQEILGIHYCANPEFFYTVGTIALLGYHAATITCCILAVDRFFILIFPEVSKKLFGGKMVYFWILLPIVYVFIFSTQGSDMYTSTVHAYHFDPYIGAPGFGSNPRFYVHPFLLANSCLVVFLMGPIYTILCLSLYLKPKSLPTISKLQKVMLFQSLAICFEMFFCATVYVASMYITIPEFLAKLDQTVLICVHADTPIIYLLLNATLRKKFFEVIKGYLIKSIKTGKEVAAYASVYPTAFRNRVAASNHHFTPTPNQADFTLNQTNLTPNDPNAAA